MNTTRPHAVSILEQAVIESECQIVYHIIMARCIYAKTYLMHTCMVKFFFFTQSENLRDFNIQSASCVSQVYIVVEILNF